MSSQKTTNLGLNKWILSDYVQVSEFNDNFDKIDGTIGDHASQLADITQDIGDKSILDWLPKDTATAIKNLRDWMTQKSINVRTPPYNMKADGTDETAIMQQAITDSTTKQASIYCPDGTYGISATLKSPNNLKVFGNGKTTVFKALGNLNVNTSTSNNSGQFFEVNLVNGVKITDIYFDGQNFNAGAICISGSNDVTFSNCYSYNSLTQAVNVANQGTTCPQNIIIAFNRMENVLHGAQLWDVDDVLIFGNRVNQVKGGLWHAVSRNVRYIGNYVQNCEDVGIDMEGGENCLAQGNIVTGCKNGELTFFKGNANNKNWGKNLSFKNNIVIATDNYTKRDGTTDTCSYGGLTVHSVNPGAAEQLTYKDNEVYIYGTRYGIYTDVLDSTVLNDCGLRIVNNDFHIIGNGYAHRFQAAIGTTFKNNNFIFRDQNGQQNEIKNAFRSEIENNTYYYKGGRSGSNYAVLLYTDTSSNDTLTYVRNKFKGTGEFSLKTDAYNNAGKSVFYLEDNSLSEVPVNNGGLLQSANYGAYFVNQKLKVLVAPTGTFDINSLTAVNHSNGNKRAVVRGELMIETDSSRRNAYSILFYKTILKSYDGSGASTGIVGDATFYATFSGTTFAFPTFSYTTHNTNLNVVLNS
jgi:parallel beta-helix repeat protein